MIRKRWRWWHVLAAALALWFVALPVVLLAVLWMRAMGLPRESDRS